ncbi:50S ribosomal protein L28 [Tepidimicrobium xylanilyticum]|uniref:Large ribosomal subunit protein bL28 n=1 Tax=Tepidimicrobium xylanilyticum TaxID=1123352 RepID=A0A1H2YQ20_9FIRM|nr:50S ribosomal protein L28 [Tepidimicrobium xylanilyticum]GMG97183.1 50S ribosomal protein L28 [Tepidimicrobium xylanilyticum]SDX07267.1 LSU ribosomal protein L28P [Tepidimicrobium xylanilyticum]
MARKCEVCGKGKIFGNKVTFSNKKSRRDWSPNIRRVRAVVDGTVKRINVCTRCLRSGYVERAL